MNQTARTVIVFVLTFIILIAIFWFALPVLGIADLFGPLYFFIVLAGSLILSIFISRLLSKIIR